MSASSVLYYSLIDIIFSLPLCNLVTVCPTYTCLFLLLPFYWFLVLILVHIHCSCTNKMVHCYSCRSAGITPVMESHTKIWPLCMLSNHYISSESYTDVRCHKTRIFLSMCCSLDFDCPDGTAWRYMEREDTQALKTLKEVEMMKCTIFDGESQTLEVLRAAVSSNYMKRGKV